MSKEANIMNFKNKTMKQIRLWAWAAAVLPITALAGIFFVWAFFDKSVVSIFMISGQTIMFAAAVIWWWWAMFTMKKLVKHWDGTRDTVSDVLSEVKEMKKAVFDVLKKEDK